MFKSLEESKRAYMQYINEHKANVVESWNKLQILFVNEPFVTDKYINYYITNLVKTHDDSKYSDVEFEAYRKYFYPLETETNKEIIQKEYDKAWINHYSNNPHHWEYWVDFDRDKERECLRFIREAYVVERICDWMAMSKFQGNNVVDWYEENKNKIYHSDEDKKFLEHILYNLKNIDNV